MVKSWLVSTILITSLSSFASDKQLNKIFSRHFYTQYKASECIENIKSFIKSAKKQKIDLEKAKILEISNKGYTNFGFINAEYVRSSGKINKNYPKFGFRRFSGEKNWKFHYVLEYQGQIFDFDFGNEPRVLKSKEYFEKMFLEEKTLEEGGVLFVGEQVKLTEYLVRVHEVKDFMKYSDSPEDNPKAMKYSLRDFLKVR